MIKVYDLLRISAKLVVVFLFVLLTAEIALCNFYTNLGKTIRYVSADATGSATGLDWTNAYTNLPAQLNRDYVYFIAGSTSTYGSYSFDDALSGTDYIYIVKATDDDHGTDTGWSSSYATNQAKWTGWDVEYGYYIFDGQEGGGPNNWTTGHGFKIAPETCNDSDSCSSTATQRGIDAASGYRQLSHLQFLHMEWEGCEIQRETASGYQKRDTAIYSNYGISDSTFAYIYSHDWAGLHVHFYSGSADFSDNTFEYSYFQNQAYASGSPCSIHGEAMQFKSGGGTNLNVHIRWNVFENFYGTAGIAFQDEVQGGYAVYGNLFFFSVFDGTYEAHTGTIFAGSEAHSNMLIYNNTFVDLTSSNSQNSNIYIMGGSDNYARNNLWVNCDSPRGATGTGMTGSNNETEGSTSLFINYAGDDFRLSQETAAGYTLGAPYNVDMYGNVRGTDGNWDLGAFEYVDGQVIVPPEISAPQSPDPVQQVVPISVVASSDDGNIPGNTIDGDFDTRWSAEGTDVWIEFDLGSNKVLSHVQIAWFLGLTQIANFALESSSDGTNWTQEYNGTSRGTASLEIYKILSKTPVRYIRIMGYGSNINDWNSITEVVISELL